jgi:hypothetical protein
MRLRSKLNMPGIVWHANIIPIEIHNRMNRRKKLRCLNLSFFCKLFRNFWCFIKNFLKIFTLTKNPSQLINEAYNILSDPVFRTWYDYLGSMGVQFRIGWANRWEAAKERVAEKATKSMHYAPLSKTMACFGLEKEYQELGQTIREERRIPGEVCSTQIKIKCIFYRYIVLNMTYCLIPNRSKSKISV